MFELKGANMLQALKKRSAIKSYRKKLGPYLVKNYGKQKHYTPAQVRKGAEAQGLDPIALCYGMAMYTSRDDFNSYHQSTGQNCDYDTMRGEIADTSSGWFGGLFDSGNYDSCHHSGHDFGGHDGGFDGGGDASD